MRHRPAVLLAVVTALVAGCGAEPTPEPVTVTVTAGPEGEETPASPNPTESAAPTPLPDVAPEDSAPFVADTSPDTAAPSSGALLSAIDLRFGVHDGYDRLVLDLSGTGEPGWRAAYTDDPSGQASGEPVDLEGSAYLEILVQGIIYPGEEGSLPYEGPQRIVPASGGVIRDIVFGSLFEGTQEIFVGVASEQPFRVFLLEDPTRIVLDVQHP